MAIGGIFGAAAASGGRYVNPKPTATYNSLGVFNITNWDATANYSANSTVTAGSLTFTPQPAPTPPTVSLSAADSIATVRNKSVKGVVQSPSIELARTPFTYTYVATPPPATGPCYPYQPAGGTRYSGTWMRFNPGPYTYLNPAPGFTQAPSEWYRIT